MNTINRISRIKFFKKISSPNPFSKDYQWTLVSNNLGLTSRRFSIRQLRPDAEYQLRVRANSDAGSAEKTYDFETT